MKFENYNKTRSLIWTSISFLLALMTIIFNTVKLARVFSLKILRGIPREWTFELNGLLSISFFFHLMGFVYAIGLPEKDDLSEFSRDQIFSAITAIFIIIALVFHIISTVLLIDYSPPNYLLI